MACDHTSTRQAQETIDRLTQHLAERGVPAAAIQALAAGTDPGPCHHLRAASFCQLDLGHPEESHLAVHTPAPGTKTETEWAQSWSEHDRKHHFAYDTPFRLPAPHTAAMRAHAELVDDPAVFICQPVTDTLLYVHIWLGEHDAGLDTWLHRIGVQHEQARRTEHGDYLARGHHSGARVALIAHAASYR
ncbi:hypothetical protein [Streptomyces sp. NBC_00470]|uniref:hypothetical protein n=1 Tax=Streptomyces sp. NBC_00470 TaxID=2975753 RepID=UPI002F91891D